MTLSQAIARADGAMPNNMPHPEKLRHLSTLDGRIRRELIDLCEGGPAEDFIPYEERPDFDPTESLLAPAPYDGLYTHYLAAMIAQAEGESQRYAEERGFFTALYTSYSLDYLRRHRMRRDRFCY